MIKKSERTATNDTTQSHHSSTRDAVETAIDTAKENKSKTWEAGPRAAKKITRWQPLTHSKNER